MPDKKNKRVKVFLWEFLREAEAVVWIFLENQEKFFIQNNEEEQAYTGLLFYYYYSAFQIEPESRTEVSKSWAQRDNTRRGKVGVSGN